MSVTRLLPRTPPGPPPLISMDSNSIVSPPGFPCSLSMQSAQTDMPTVPPPMMPASVLKPNIRFGSQNFIETEQNLYSMAPQIQRYRDNGMSELMGKSSTNIPPLQRFHKNVSPSLTVLSDTEVISLD